MKKECYSLRDLQSFDRTYLSNERTLLAYIRTFVGLLGAGAALLKLFDVAWAHTAGIALLVFSPLVLGFGIWRFFHTIAKLRAYRNRPEDEDDEDE